MILKLVRIWRSASVNTKNMTALEWNIAAIQINMARLVSDDVSQWDMIHSSTPIATAFTCAHRNHYYKKGIATSSASQGAGVVRA